tara:strand:- start:891 stop:1196 length:306 start_codon:yes stop_codon:yes gene_type:complete
MDIRWNDKYPIYRQLYDRFVELILEGVFEDGDALPSVRQIAAEQRINHITISKSFQMLVDEGLVEKRRGLGMFVCEGASANLAEIERKNSCRRSGQNPSKR